MTTRDKQEAMTDYLILIYKVCWGQAAVVVIVIYSEDKN